jgi:hypothetical protein
MPGTLQTLLNSIFIISLFKFGGSRKNKFLEILEAFKFFILPPGLNIFHDSDSSLKTDLFKYFLHLKCSFVDCIHIRFFLQSLFILVIDCTVLYCHVKFKHESIRTKKFRILWDANSLQMFIIEVRTVNFWLFCLCGTNAVDIKDR